MIGQGRPTTIRSSVVQALASAWIAVCAATAAAGEIEVRLRFAWGSGAQAPQKWVGDIAADGARLTDLRPLGIEADEAAALQLADNAIVVAPLVPRAFDGCDVTVRGDPASLVTFRLRSTAMSEARDVQASLEQLATEELRAPLDDLGAYLLVQRAPGDKLRVRIDRAHLVYAPGDVVQLVVQPDLVAALAAGPLTLEARLTGGVGGDVVWESSTSIEQGGAEVALELPAPTEEGAYRLTLAAVRPAGIAGKLVPWEQSVPIAARDVEFVVVDPAARLPRLTSEWVTVQTVDPASTKWWRRVPEWTQLDRLPVLSASRSWGNVKPQLPPGGPPGFVELPTPALGAEPTWQAYSLSVEEVSAPHAVEIELPADARQHLAVSIIEPDAAGRVLSFGRDAGIYHDGDPAPDAAAQVVRRRIIFWPRTASPVLLLTNQSAVRPVQFGAIRVVQRTVEPVSAAATDPPLTAAANPGRLVAAYIGAPRLADCLGSAKVLDGDVSSGLSVDGWNTFLDAGRRLAQQLRADGYNAAVVCIAADGSSLAAIDALGSSPRYDTGPLSSSGADPLRKDVLEALLRVFDREGLRLVPAIELATPLPTLEALRRTGDPRNLGAELIGADGRTWMESHPGELAGPHYNLLDARVQAAISGIFDELTARYGHHTSFAGIAVGLSGRGYGVLPGLAWGLDDATAARFAEEMQVELPAEGDDRFAKRAEIVLGPQRVAWRQWRQARLSRFYAELGQHLTANRPELQLVLCTQNLFAGQSAQQDLRLAVSGRESLDEAAAELGIDLRTLSAEPGICLLRPRRLGSDDQLQTRALDLAINAAAELDAALVNQPQNGELSYYASRRLRLESFDAQSPFGADRTYLALSVPGFTSGDVARRPLATALAGRDFFTVVEGADVLPLVEDEQATQMRRVFAQLPGADAEVRVERQQPLVLRVYRTATATTACVINESPWPVAVNLRVEVSEPAAWQDLGADAAAPASAETAGTWPAGTAAWKLALPPYSVAARRFETRNLRVGALSPQVGPEAKASLAARIVELEQRMRSLDVERPYAQLQNPDFELVGAEGRMLGWQPRIGKLGLAVIDGGAAQQGERALHLRSEDALGVAAQSHLFPMPATGQLVVRAQVRGDAASRATLYAWVEYDAGGVTQLQHLPLAAGPFDGKWNRCEAAFDDLPLVATGQMRVQFHLAGAGEAWVDHVELFDLRFSEERRLKLARQLYSARTFLDDGQLVDCQRVLDGYWPRYLVEYLPATPALSPAEIGPTPPLSVASRPDDQPAAAPAEQEADEASGFGGRVRSALPRVFRR